MFFLLISYVTHFSGIPSAPHFTTFRYGGGEKVSLDQTFRAAQLIAHTVYLHCVFTQLSGVGGGWGDYLPGASD